MSDLVERLEPCPFCGGKAEWHDITEADEIANIGGSCIVCTQCQACGPVQFGEKDTIVEHWNRRAESPELARLRSEVERLTRELDEAHGYASRFLTSFVAQHCNPVPGWAPLHDLIGVLTQIDNASTVARKYRSELTTLTARTREVLAPFAEWFPEEALRRVPPDQRLMTTGLEARHFRAANTLFNELKEKDNG